jgi:hypothetical protein
MKKLILVSFICLLGFISYSQTYIYRVKVRVFTNQGWVRDTVYCEAFHEAKNFKDTFQIFDYRIYGTLDKVGNNESCTERGQFRTKYYCWGPLVTRDTIKLYIQKKYNLEAFPLRVTPIQWPQ